MKSASAKQKGRNLQKMVRDYLITYGGGLTSDDVISRSSGSNGEDIILSPAARAIFPYSFECKNRARISLYKDFEQTKSNNPDSTKYAPVLVIKQNHSDPLIVMSFKDWIVMAARDTQAW